MNELHWKSMIVYPIKKWFLFGTIAAVALASVGLLAWTFQHSSDEMILVKWRAVIDVRDDRQLAGFAHDVFFGQVVDKLGQKDNEAGEPTTHFKVKVLEVFKGSVTGEVEVRQVGGWSWRDFRPYRLEGDLQLLEPGKSYLFVTRTSQPRQLEGWHTLVPGYGDIKIRVPAHATEAEVLGSQHANKLRQRFTAAVEHQIPYGH